jgi:hypothetical protein
MALFSMDEMAASLGDVLKDLHVDDDVIKQITSDLVSGAHEIDDLGFDKMHVANAVFGESSIGGSLAYHHRLAHSKVSETLQSVLEDLATFRSGLKTFQKAVDDADTQSADDLKRRQAAVVSLGQAAGFQHTHRTDEYYHRYGGTPGSPAVPSAAPTTPGQTSASTAGGPGEGS